MATSIYIIAGEVSGDLLGGKLLKALKPEIKKLTIHGVGGSKMKQQGLKTLFPMRELSLMGFAEIIPHIPKLLKRINQTVDDIIAKQPDLVITIDSPGFTTRVVKQLRKKGFSGKCVHYVAPTVWAYKPERAAKMAKLFDHLLTLFPFEPSYFKQEGLETTFVGHSIIEDNITEGDNSRFRKKHKLTKDHVVISMLPGSREGEVKRHLNIFIGVVNKLHEHQDNIVVVIPTIPRLKSLIDAEKKKLNTKVIITTKEQDKYDAYAASTAALTKSGTVTLELGIANVPMVVAYKVHPVSGWLIKRMLIAPYVCLINIILNKYVVKEYLQDNCNINHLYDELNKIVSDKNYRQKQEKEIKKAVKMLAHPSGKSASHVAADTIKTQIL